ncbi:MAG: nucleotidyltransferase [Lachnospiraceae bacterium]|nr:nucleotidyltransferase [Lachnospiraceae bacterium]
MKVNGIIAEYNPFHSGHLYQLEDAKARTGADYTVIAMSGNFMQRGTPALVDKYKRARMALECGADLVLEIPVFYSVSSAEYFATGAVALLDKLGVVDHLCFGAECDDLHVLQQIADIFLHEPEEFSTLIKQYTKEGYSYPSARAVALNQFRPDLYKRDDVLVSSNNILAIEYLKALKKRSSSIEPLSTLRRSSDYRDRMLTSHQSSALAIRQAIYDNRELSALAEQIPPAAFRILRKAIETYGPVRLNDFSAILHYRLLMEADNGYTQYLDVSPELSDRIRGHLYEFTDFRSFCDLLKTKELTYTRISRCLMHILLDIKATDVYHYMYADCVQYARVLGFRKDSQPLLTAIKENASIPLVTKLADAKKQLGEYSHQMLQKELQISAIHSSTVAVKSGTSMKNEFRSPLVII